MKTAYIFLAAGFEEIEALATVDILRRAQLNVVTVSVTDELEVVGAHNVGVLADTVVDCVEVGSEDWLICPGGLPGADNLFNCKTLAEMLQEHNAKGGNIAAICAAPAVVLAPLGIIKGKNATCYPGFEAKLAEGGATAKNDRVVVDGNVITGNGPASAIPFALAIAEQAASPATAQAVAQGMLC